MNYHEVANENFTDIPSLDEDAITLQDVRDLRRELMKTPEELCKENRHSYRLIGEASEFFILKCGWCDKIMILSTTLYKPKDWIK